jgi:hypothetical protein
MKSSKKRSSLFSNNPTIPELEEYIKDLNITEKMNFILEKMSKRRMKKYLEQNYR